MDFYKKIGVAFLGGIFALGLLPDLVHSENSADIVLYWHTFSYVPGWYRGKALPRPGSMIEASFVAMDGNGKIVDTSRMPVYWYLDNSLISQDYGLRKVSFLVPEDSRNRVSLRVHLPSLAGGSVKTIKIPLAEPKVVVESRLPGNYHDASSLGVSAHPFFFSVSDINKLSFQWSVNGQIVKNSENPGFLKINVAADAPDGSTVNVSTTVKNPRDSQESASGNAIITIKK